MSDNRPELLVSRENAKQRISEQIGRGQSILEKVRYVLNEPLLRTAKQEEEKWRAYNCDLLSSLFSTNAISEEFKVADFYPIAFFGDYSIQDEGRDFKLGIEKGITYLDSLIERLEFFKEKEDVAKSNIPNPTTMLPHSNKVFLVHGQDDGAKEMVARVIEKLNLEAVILHEQVNSGDTIIEKFEKNANVCSYAIVLLTPDDIGYPKNKTELASPRARQNVVFELGYFFAKLGRNRVCAILKENVEIPSDISGVVYVHLRDEWKFTLAKELKYAGFDVNVNALL